MYATDEVERRIAGNESQERIAEAAREGGMRSLWESAVQHVRNGETTIDELATRAKRSPVEMRPHVRATRRVRARATRMTTGPSSPTS